MFTKRELGRATLARQMLLERAGVPVSTAIDRLAGMQAQEPKPPYIGLWSRVRGFTPADLIDAVHRREIVRVTAMRATLHLMSTRDYVEFRPVLHPALVSAMESILKNRGEGIDVDGVAREAAEFFASREATFDEFRAALAERRSEIDIRAAAYAARMMVPLVQVPDSSRWGWTADPMFTAASGWIGVDIATDRGAGLDSLVRRYLAAFGPATPADFTAWSGLKGAKAVFDRLRPTLVTFHDERKRELFDLPDAPRPAVDTPCPVRFLPDFDNLMLAHADRTRIIPDEHRRLVATPNLRINATFLVDGLAAGTWKIETKRKTASLLLSPFEPISALDARDLIDEGERLLHFIEPEATGYEVVVVK